MDDYLKVGDLVVVHKPSNAGRFLSWLLDMDIYDGALAKIDSISFMYDEKIVELAPVASTPVGISRCDFSIDWVSLYQPFEPAGLDNFLNGGNVEL